MFEKGEYVVYGSKGVCEVTDISHINMPNADKERLYYILHPVNNEGDKVYLPTDSQKAVLRKLITREDAKKLLKDIPVIEQLWVENEKNRELEYRETMRNCDCRELVGIIKTLCERKNERLAMGKKVTALDERYLRAAKSELYGELSMVLATSVEDIHDCLKQYIDEL